MSRTLPATQQTKECTLLGPRPTFGAPTYTCTQTYESLIASQGHYQLTAPNGAIYWSGGGPFYCAKYKLSHSAVHTLQYRYAGGPERIHVNQGCGGIIGSMPVPAIPSWASVQALLNAKTAAGRQRTRPGNPVAGMGQFLVELRDLPAIPLKGLLGRGSVKRLRGFAPPKPVYRSVPFSQVPRYLLGRLTDFRSLGSEYLNIVFGWKPFVSDLRKMYHLWHDIDKRMAQIIHENGKGIRRKAVLESDVSTTELTPTLYGFAYGGIRSPPPNVFGSWNWETSTGTGTNGRTIRTGTTRTEKKIWYVAKYRYWIPDTSSSLWDKRARLALFGALPTPELLWNVLPWSWLIDWFSDVGSVMSNISPNAVDNLVSLYSFIMMKQRVTEFGRSAVMHDSISLSGAHWPSVNYNFDSTYESLSMSRLGGNNPFGIGVQLNSLSTGQLAILAALGLSRSSVK